MTRARRGRSTQLRYEIAEQVLRSNIAEGVLPKGLVLLEGPIAEILQTSRAPIQRALLSLEADGLIHRFKGRGYLVGSAADHVVPERTDIKSLGLVFPSGVDEALQSRSSWERIYNIVERDVAGCVVFGQYRIIEIELAEHFHVSRTVVRDVLSRLQERGLVYKNQSSHWIAGPLTAKSIKDHFALRRMLEPPALISAAPRIDSNRLTALLERLRALEEPGAALEIREIKELETLLIDTCILATPNEKLSELIRHNLLPVIAAEQLLRQLGLPLDRAAITEHRLIVELMIHGSIDAAATMLAAHLDAAMKRNIAQIKIVAVIPAPTATAAYLTRVTD